MWEIHFLRHVTQSKGKSRHFLRLNEAVASLKLPTRGTNKPIHFSGSFPLICLKILPLFLFFVPAQAKKCWSCDYCLLSLLFLLFFQKVNWRKEQENHLSSNPVFCGFKDAGKISVPFHPVLADNTVLTLKWLNNTCKHSAVKSNLLPTSSLF